MQQEAAKTDGPVLVISSVGSGKTRTLTRRVSHLLAEGVPASQLLILAFTNKAANEIQDRLQRPIPWLGTFHSCSLRILKSHLQYIDYRKCVIYNNKKTLALVKRILKERNKREDPTMVQRFINYKIHLLSSRDIDDVEMQSLYAQYEISLKETSALDFEDMIKRTVEILQCYKEVRRYYQDMFRYILVDEFQDVNYSQYQLLKLLTPRENNIFLVGDPDQGIYSFRGADMQCILSFKKDFPSGSLFKREENYRSTKTIVKASNVLIKANNSQKMSYTNNQKGSPIMVYEAWDEEEESFFVIQSVKTQRQI